MLGAKSQLPVEVQTQVDAAVEEIRAVVARHGDPGLFAYGLLGAELAAKD
jgi:hypothetical protein